MHYTMKPANKTTYYACIDRNGDEFYEEVGTSKEYDPVSGTIAGGSSGSGNASTGTQTCSNGVIDSGEVCDGSNLKSQTCQTQGFASGTLKCGGRSGFECKELDRSSCEGKPPTSFTAPEPTKEGNMIKVDYTSINEYVWKYAYARLNGTKPAFPSGYSRINMTGTGAFGGTEFFLNVASGDISKANPALTDGIWQIFPAGCIYKGSESMFQTYIPGIGNNGDASGPWKCGFNEPLVYVVAPQNSTSNTTSNTTTNSTNSTS